MSIRAAALASLLALALILVTAPAASQDADAPPPSPDDRILYAHHQEDADEEFEGWMNTVSNDTDSDDAAMGESPGISECNGPVPVPGVDSDVEATWTLTLDPELEENISFEDNGTIFVKAYIGASGGDGEELEVNTTLRAGDVVVAESETKTHNYTAADDGQYDSIEWEMQANGTEIEAGTDLVWEIHLEGEACSVESGPFLGVSQERGKSAIMLPLIEPEPPVTFEELVGPEARISLQFDEPTNAVFVYNWSVEAGTYDMAAASDLVNGTVFVEITAPDGQTKSFLLERQRAVAEEAIETTNGTWQIRISVEEAQGELAAGIRPSANMTGPGGPDAGNQTSFPDDDGAGGNDTSRQFGDDEEGEDSPGLGVVVALVGLVASAVAYRTRRSR